MYKLQNQMVRSDIKRTFTAFNMKELVPSQFLFSWTTQSPITNKKFFVNNVFKKIASINYKENIMVGKLAENVGFALK